jgi:hypothetical protein
MRGELRHAAAVAFGEVQHGLLAGGPLDGGLAPGEEERGGEAFEVPLEGAGDGLVEVIDVEEQTAVERAGIGAEVFHVGVAAELGEQAGVGWAARSAAMMGTAPRKKPKGEATMRWCLSATSAGTRPRSDSWSRRSGSLGQWAREKTAWPLRASRLRAARRGRGARQVRAVERERPWSQKVISDAAIYKAGAEDHDRGS